MLPNHDSVKKNIASLAICFLAACASPPNLIEQRVADAYQTLEDMRRDGIVNHDYVRNLHRTFAVHNELYGVYLADLTLCEYPWSDGGAGKTYCQKAIETAEVMGDNKTIFAANLQAFYTLGEDDYLSAADSVAVTNAQHNTIHVLRGEPERVVALEEGEVSTLALANAYYWRGKNSSDLEALALAQSLYQSLGAARGVADTLFLKAKILQRRGQAAAAKEAAYRASIVLGGLDAEEESSFIKQWMYRHGYRR